MMSVRLYGLRACIRRFSENGKYAQCGKWSMGRGGYDEWFSLYYDEFPMLKCVAGELSADSELGYRNFCNIAKIILDRYPNTKVSRETLARMDETARNLGRKRVSKMLGLSEISD